MIEHDRLAAHELVHRWYLDYDEGRLERLADLLTDDCHFSSRTETGTHPHEEFIASDQRGAASCMAWTAEHRAHSPYPLRHNASNLHVSEQRADELDLACYLFVTRITGRSPVALSSGIVRWTLRLAPGGYRIAAKHTVLDSIESAPFAEVDFVSDRMGSW